MSDTYKLHTIELSEDLHRELHRRSLKQGISIIGVLSSLVYRDKIVEAKETLLNLPLSPVAHSIVQDAILEVNLFLDKNKI